MIINSNELDTGIEKDYDLCIIGGGALGLTIANEMVQSGVRVAVLESGGEEFNQSTQDLYKGPVSAEKIHHEALDKCRDRQLGGSSNSWGGWCLPLQAQDFKKRKGLTLGSWPLSYQNDFSPFIQKACNVLDIGLNNFQNREILDRPELVSGIEKSSILQTRFIKHSPPTRLWEKFSAPLAEADSVDIYKWANVDHIEWDPASQSVQWVNVKTLSGKSFRFKSKFFVLASGGIETPRILLNSNNKMAEGIGNHSGQVGKNYHSHPVIKVLYSLNHGSIYRHGRENNHEGIPVERVFVLKDKIQDQHQLLNSFFQVSQNVGNFLSQNSPKSTQPQEDNQFLLSASTEMELSSKSFLELIPETDALGMKKIKLNFEVSERVFDHLIRSTRLVASELSRLNIARFNMTSKHEDLIRSQHLVRYHHMGTTIMSESENTGVVDPHCRVFGTKNLYIAGCSTFPTGGHANPMLSQVALALRLSDRLRSQL